MTNVRFNNGLAVFFNVRPKKPEGDITANPAAIFLIGMPGIKKLCGLFVFNDGLFQYPTVIQPLANTVMGHITDPHAGLKHIDRRSQFRSVNDLLAQQRLGVLG